MTGAILLAANLIAHLMYVLRCFPLLEELLEGRRYSVRKRVLIGLLNAVCVLLLVKYLPAGIAFLFAGLLLLIALFVLFRGAIKDSLFLWLSILLNIICLTGLSLSALALLFRTSPDGVIENQRLFLSMLVMSNLLKYFAAVLASRRLSLNNMKRAMKNQMQAGYILIWAGLCAVVLLHSFGLIFREARETAVLLNYLGLNLLLLLSFYFLLDYNLRFNSTAGIRSKNKELSKALNNFNLQSALMRDAIFVTQANLTQDLVISGLEVYGEEKRNRGMGYLEWFSFVREIIYPDDYDIFAKSLDRQNLLENFEKGIEPKPFEYRRQNPDGSYRWVRLVLRTFREMESGDVHIFGYAFDIEKEVRDREALLKNAQTDLYTGLYNKATTELLIGEEIRKGAGILLLVDIDNFKSINDSYGHLAGDAVLKQFSQLLTAVFRKIDIVGRTGGDEFTIYIKDTTDLVIAEKRVQSLLELLEGGVLLENRRIYVTISVGLVVVDEKINSFSVAYSRADNALYQAKKTGKNGYVVYAGQKTRFPSRV